MDLGYGFFVIEQNYRKGHKSRGSPAVKRDATAFVF